MTAGGVTAGGVTSGCVTAGGVSVGGVSVGGVAVAEEETDTDSFTDSSSPGMLTASPPEASGVTAGGLSYLFYARHCASFPFLSEPAGLGARCPGGKSGCSAMRWSNYDRSEAQIRVPPTGCSAHADCAHSLVHTKQGKHTRPLVLCANQGHAARLRAHSDAQSDAANESAGGDARSSR